MAALLCIGCIMAALLLAGAVQSHCCLAQMGEWLLQYYQPLIPFVGSTRIVYNYMTDVSGVAAVNVNPLVSVKLYY